MGLIVNGFAKRSNNEGPLVTTEWGHTQEPRIATWSHCNSH